MPVSASQIREIRSTLDDIGRLLENEPEYDSFVAELSRASTALDEVSDDRGQVRDRDEGPKLGSRVKQPADMAGAMADEGKPVGGPRR